MVRVSTLLMLHHNAHLINMSVTWCQSHTYSLGVIQHAWIALVIGGIPQLEGPLCRQLIISADGNTPLSHHVIKTCSLLIFLFNIYFIITSNHQLVTPLLCV
jgi:hypothetical protein